jgi:hypothetical protein
LSLIEGSVRFKASCILRGQSGPVAQRLRLRCGVATPIGNGVLILALSHEVLADGLLQSLVVALAGVVEPRRLKCNALELAFGRGVIEGTDGYSVELELGELQSVIKRVPSILDVAVEGLDVPLFVAF